MTRTYFNDGDELVATTLPREPERARRKGGAGCTLTATLGLSSRASRALLPVAEQSTAVATRSRHGGNIGLAKLDARAERQAGLSSASDGTSRTRARGDVANARHASSRTGLELSCARTTQGTSPVRRTSVPGETRPRRLSRQRFFDRVLKKRACVLRRSRRTKKQTSSVSRRNAKKNRRRRSRRSNPRLFAR